MFLAETSHAVYTIHLFFLSIVFIFCLFCVFWFLFCFILVNHKAKSAGLCYSNIRKRFNNNNNNNKKVDADFAF